MTEPHVQEELLQRYFDGDLQSREASSVRGHLASCDECTARHVQLSALHRLITLSAEQVSEGVDFERAFAHIEREVRAQREAGVVVRMADWFTTTVQERPERLWAPALGAAAALVLLFWLTRGPQAPELAEVAPTGPESPTGVAVTGGTNGSEAGSAAHERGLPDDALAMGSKVEAVDFGDTAGTVYEVALADGVSTPVVWINDDVLE